MTMNIGNGLAPPRRLASWLRSNPAGIVGLQEVDEVQAAEIQSDLRERYPHQAVYGTGFSGRALISRYPILAHEMVQLRPGKLDLLAKVQLPGMEVTVLVAHPSPPRLQLRGIVSDPETGTHVNGMLETVLATAPAIILGDFNMTQRNPHYKSLRDAGLADAFHAVGTGCGATFPVRPGRMRSINHRMYWVPLIPFTRIDYVFHTPDLEATESWVGPNFGSDHLPVFARLSLAGHSN
jgi:endonuclease/exonuclease/phosphatase family metal-dependent hydrolase